ncbi:MAG: hypothetical protein HYU37_16750 [Acidobacteria bacterium]|nr:hypothetical protein [Acidobacteriota bacterium]
MSYADEVADLTGCLDLATGANGFEPLDDLIRNLRGDAFADAYGVYIRDLEPLLEQGRTLGQQMRQLARAECDPFELEQGQWRAQKTELINSGCIGTVPPETFAGCAPRINSLNAWRDRLDARRQAAQQRINATLREANAVVQRAEGPVRNAELVLNPDHAEDAFHLYMLWYLRQHGSPPADSCAALADLATALGRRVRDRDQFIDRLTRNLVNPESPLRRVMAPPAWRPLAGRTFGAAGFKPKFFTNTADNQVRHAAAHMRLGYALRTASSVYTFGDDLAARYVRGRTPEWDDYYLGLAAGYLGFKLRSGLVGVSDFGDAIRTDLCN